RQSARSQGPQGSSQVNSLALSPRPLHYQPWPLDELSLVRRLPARCCQFRQRMGRILANLATRMPKASSKSRVRPIMRALAKLYPDAHCALRFDNPLQLLIATMLSAQCTDVRVNLVTPALFARYANARAFAEADIG